MDAIVKVKAWGNSLGVRIPAAVAQTVGLAEDSTVKIKAEKGRVVIEPAQQTSFELEALLAGITKKNRHSAVDSGDPVGREVL